MAQGKLKVKSKVPDSVAKKKKQQNSSKTSKVVKKGKKTPKAQAAQLTARFKKDLGKKINANIIKATHNNINFFKKFTSKK